MLTPQDLTPAERAQVVAALGIDAWIRHEKAKQAHRTATFRLEQKTNQLTAVRGDYDTQRQDLEARTLIELERLRRPVLDAEEKYAVALGVHEAAAAELALAAAADAEL
jgi:hypothetical protein